MVKATTTPKTPKTPRTPKRKEPKPDNNNGGASVEKQENEAKRAKQQPDLKSFFKPLEKPAPPPTLPQCMPEASLFSNSRFQLKEGMRLAPALARQPLIGQKRDNLLDQRSEHSDYLTACKSLKKNLAKNMDEKKAKYFHFHDNYRPPYYGTWRRRSAAISGRRPFCKRESTLNYEYDSDEDWEEEPADADECKSEDEEMEKEEVESDSDNDGFFVEHGYLSTDEGSGADDDDDANGKKGPDGEEKPPRHSAGGEPDEHRRRRLEEKAEDWKDQQRQKERRYKKRQLIPTVYLPEESGIHEGLHRNILPGVLFDYAQILAAAVGDEKPELDEKPEEDGKSDDVKTEPEEKLDGDEQPMDVEMTAPEMMAPAATTTA